MTDPAGTLHFDLSGLRVWVSGLTPKLAGRLVAEWSGFASSDESPAFLELRCAVEPEGPDDSAYSPRAIESAFERGGACYRMKEARLDVPPDGPARLRLATTTAERQYLALTNLAGAAVAWRLPLRGGAMLHAAGIVLNGRAFVLVGPEGSGKTTWALLAKGAGATVLSDDVVVVDPSSDGRYEVLGTPFRSRQHGTSGRGRWPLAAILLPEHGPVARLGAVSGLAVRARLMANLPFVAEAAAHDDRSDRLLELLAAAVPARTLTFNIDPGFIPVLAAFGT